MPQQEYLEEAARTRPRDTSELAALLAERAHSPLMHYAAARLRLDDRSLEPRYRVRKALAFVEGLQERPAQHGQPRFPLEALVDGAATLPERSWLAATLLTAAGFSTALAVERDGPADALAVAHLFDPDGYVEGPTLPDPERGVTWRVCRPGGPPPGTASLRLQVLSPDPAAASPTPA